LRNRSGAPPTWALPILNDQGGLFLSPIELTAVIFDSSMKSAFRQRDLRLGCPTKTICARFAFEFTDLDR
jgi:hypothetical protein